MSWFLSCLIRREIIVHFVDIGGIIDRDCLKVPVLNSVNPFSSIYAFFYTYIFSNEKYSMHLSQTTKMSKGDIHTGKLKK